MKSLGLVMVLSREVVYSKVNLLMEHLNSIKKELKVEIMELIKYLKILLLSIVKQEAVNRVKHKVKAPTDHQAI